MPSRTFTVAAAVVSTVVLAAGITYASTDGSTQAEPAPARAEQPVHRAAPPARQAVPAPAPVGSESGTEDKGDKGGNGGGDEGSDRGGRDDEGGDRGGRDDEGGRGGRDDEGGGRGGRDRGHDRKRERIFFNEREYGAYPGGCIPAASGLGSSSFSIYNDSRHAVEVFRGFACDGGSPVATVGPYGSTYGVVTPNVRGGGFIDNGVAGSFRVIGHDEEW
ncbi:MULTISPECIES: hypothetical protein [unclassified Streptomyces]|uniref:hypothetical protein n=1 Tax=unclassified Streptomyces TaxID=2593676 RepID=UPI000FB3FD7A|nr:MULTISPECIES: hypothetical protein [unclassified Streptomyces]RPK58494.1 hypothetical protein EES42_37345 [Streptomyces sp. ADI95-17]WSC29589.1 hypothetical protein OG902_24460 [Streptomyces sp. NBC_01768]WSP48424.1 hypothetical protein OG348_22575 [Streptomyces sp. NBC_01243]WSX02092.1 hypothetical protein OG355_17580 [Streptomyces sp. NBC_00987]